MWILFAFGSAFFSGITAILAKCGIAKTDSTVATAIRTVVVLLFAWLMVFIVGSEGTITSLSAHTWIFLILSGSATGASWLCYFKALQISDINKVVPIDKSSTGMTMVLAFICFHEGFSAVSAVATVLIAIGTLLMIQKKKSGARTSTNTSTNTNTGIISSNSSSNSSSSSSSSMWLVYALLSAVFAALTAILGKIGIDEVESNLGTAIRTVVVLIMAWFMVAVSHKGHLVRTVPKKELLFICLSGIATGAAWLCYYRALQEGFASVVVPIDKLSILVTIAFSYLVFHEKLTLKSAIGLALIVVGTLLMIPHLSDITSAVAQLFSS